jgi:SanA protein
VRPSSPRLRRLLLASGVATALGGALTAAANALVASEPRVVRTVESAPPETVALVLGAGVRGDGTLSAVLEDRLATAVELYRTGKARKLLLSGDHGTRDYDEPDAMARWVEARGVPASDVFLDHAGFDTYATLVRAKRVFGVERALVVSQDFHLPRALYIARQVGIDATGVRADRRPYQRAAYYALRELGARAKAVVVAGWLRPAPRFLGPAISLEGDGRLTRDR